MDMTVFKEIQEDQMFSSFMQIKNLTLNITLSIQKIDKYASFI